MKLRVTKKVMFLFLLVHVLDMHIFYLLEQIDGRVGVVVRALVFHQCGPGSISALDVLCGLGLLVVFSTLRGFSPRTPVFPSHQKPFTL